MAGITIERSRSESPRVVVASVTLGGGDGRSKRLIEQRLDQNTFLRTRTTGEKLSSCRQRNLSSYPYYCLVRTTLLRYLVTLLGAVTSE